MENCRYNHDAMQYALVKGGEGMPDLIVDVLEFHCLSMLLENKVEYDEAELNDERGNYIIAYGNVHMMPGENEKKFMEQIKELKNTCYLSVREDNINQIEIVDTLFIDIKKCRKETPLVALIRTPFMFSTYGEQCTTTFLKYGEMTATESLINRHGFISFSHYKCIELNDIEFWTKHVEKAELEKAHNYDWFEGCD